MTSGNDESKIDRRERDLYSRNAPQDTGPERGVFTKPEFDVQPQWQSPDPFVDHSAEMTFEPRKYGFFKKFFIGSVTLFAVALLTFIYMQYGGFNAVSSKNVGIFVKGPVSIGGGEELVLDITITNGNNVALDSVELLIEYPTGTRMVTNLSAELIRTKEIVGAIPAGESVTKIVKAVLFGEKDNIKDIAVSVDYKPQGSNSIFTKDKLYQIAIKSSPVLFSVDYPKEVNSNQPMQMTVTVTSNANTMIQNLLVTAQYPFGFSFESATPKPSFDTNVWSLGDLAPKEKRVIKLFGKMEGQNDEEKTFRFNAGTAKINDEKVIDVDFVATAQSILIRKPFFDVTLALNNNKDKEYVAKIGNQIVGNVTWMNNLPSSINDAVLEVRLGGGALDRNRISSDRFGFYQSITNTITWDKRTSDLLTKVEPGETGNFSFNFFTLPLTSQTLALLRNPEVTLDVNIKGIRLSDTEPPEQIAYSFSKKVKVSTEATFSTRMGHSIGPFENRGTLPPKAEKETTYTVYWTLTNSFNDLTNVSVSASLPPYVSWQDVKSPLGDRLLYDPVTNKIVWEPGEIKAGTGFSLSPREVAFQLSFLPSLGQVGLTPIIINDATFVGTDKFTGEVISILRSSLSTTISTDPIFNTGDDTVIK